MVIQVLKVWWLWFVMKKEESRERNCSVKYIRLKRILCQPFHSVWILLKSLVVSARSPKARIPYQNTADGLKRCYWPARRETRG